MRLMKRVDFRSTPGFSLLELLIVLGLIGLLVAITAPSISRSAASVRLKAATKKTAAVFRYARNEATARKGPYWVVIDREESWIAVVDRPLNAGEGEDRFEKAMVASSEGAQLYEYPESVVIGDVTVGEDKKVDAQGAFVFYPNGSSSGGEVVLQLDEVRLYTVSLDFITSTVSIQRGPSEDD